MVDLFKISEDKIHHGSLEGKYNHNWVEESFNFEAQAGKQTPLSHTKTYLGTSILKKKISIMGLVVVVGLAVIAGRTAYLQIIKGDYYRGLAEGNRIRLRPIFSERGIIYDKFHTELVENVPNFSLTMIPQDLPRDFKKREAIIDKVVSLSGVSKEKILDLLKRYSSYSYASLVVKENLDYQNTNIYRFKPKIRANKTFYYLVSD